MTNTLLFFQLDCVYKINGKCFDNDDNVKTVEPRLVVNQFKVLHYKFTKLLGHGLFDEKECSYVAAKQSLAMKHLADSDVCTYDKYETLRTESIKCRTAAMKMRIEKLKHLEKIHDEK